MATVLRRNAGWLSLTAVLIGLLAAGWWVLAPPRPAVAQSGGYTPLDAVAAAQLDTLRNEQGLDDDTLASLNASDAQLEQVLAAARSWFETNRTTLLSHWTALADQRALIRRYESERDQGQERTSELAAARQQLTQLESAYASFAAGVRQSAGQGLNEAQQTLAELMRQRRAAVMPYRALNLNAPQDRDLSAARTGYYQRLSVARDDATRAAASTDYQQALETALGTTNLQQLATLNGYLGASSARVVNAVNTVLPPATGPS